MVLVARFTGDLDRHEAAIRELWDGPLCLAERSWREQDLRQIQTELSVVLRSVPPPSGIVMANGFWVDVRTGVVTVDLLIAAPEGQAWIDDRYGEGVVQLNPVLEPIS